MRTHGGKTPTLKEGFPRRGGGDEVDPGQRARSLCVRKRRRSDPGRAAADSVARAPLVLAGACVRYLTCEHGVCGDTAIASLAQSSPLSARCSHRRRHRGRDADLPELLATGSNLAILALRVGRLPEPVPETVRQAQASLPLPCAATRSERPHRSAQALEQRMFDSVLGLDRVTAGVLLTLPPCLVAAVAPALAACCLRLGGEVRVAAVCADLRPTPAAVLGYAAFCERAYVASLATCPAGRALAWRGMHHGALLFGSCTFLRAVMLLKAAGEPADALLAEIGSYGRALRLARRAEDQARSQQAASGPPLRVVFAAPIAWSILSSEVDTAGLEVFQMHGACGVIHASGDAVVRAVADCGRLGLTWRAAAVRRHGGYKVGSDQFAAVDGLRGTLRRVRARARALLACSRACVEMVAVQERCDIPWGAVFLSDGRASGVANCSVPGICKALEYLWVARNAYRRAVSAKVNASKALVEERRSVAYDDDGTDSRDSAATMLPGASRVPSSHGLTAQLLAERISELDHAARDYDHARSLFV